jgi:catechol 2,3-dioxygenase-like lactoylglutathione lyase family enzyme
MRFALVVVALTVVGCSSKREPRESPLVAEAKRCAKDSEMECARPILRVTNLAASQRYYRDALGFKIDWDHGDPPSFGSVSRSNFVLFMCEQCQSAAGVWSMTFMHDVDKYYEELKKRGAIIQQAPADMPWGLREMQVADPDGNVIRFASHGHD